MRRKKNWVIISIATALLLLWLFSPLSYAASPNAQTVPVATQQDAQLLLQGLAKKGSINTTQEQGMQAWLASHNTSNNALFIVMALTYRELLLNPNNNLQMTLNYQKMNTQLTVKMLNFFKLLYQQYSLLPADKMQQLDYVIKQKQAEQAATANSN